MNMMRKTSGLPLPVLPNCKFGAKTFLIDHLIVYDLPVVYIGIESINRTHRQRRGERQTWRADNSLKELVRGRQMREGMRGRHDRADMESRQLT